LENELDTNSTQKSSSGTSVVSWSFTLMYLFAIMGIEVSLLLGVKPAWGVLVYGLMLSSLFVFAALVLEVRSILIGLSGIPIIRIVSYGIPFSNITLTTHFGMTGFILLFYVFISVRMPDLEISHILKFPRNWLTQILIIIGGIVVGFCQFWVYPQSALYFSGPFELIAFVAALALLAFVEEVIFRGMALTGFTKRFSPALSVVFVAFAYTSLFIPFSSIGVGLVMFLTSLFYGFAVVRSSGLYGVIGAHIVSSILYYLILPSIWH